MKLQALVDDEARLACPADHVAAPSRNRSFGGGQLTVCRRTLRPALRMHPGENTEHAAVATAHVALACGERIVGHSRKQPIATYWQAAAALT